MRDAIYNIFVYHSALKFEFLHETNNVFLKAQTRGEAHGSRRKLYKQKGTGKARVGDNRSAIR